jgi:hypothetical protein
VSLVLAGFGLAAGRAVDADRARTDFEAAADFIEERWEAGDVVADGATLTPVPLTGLDVYLPQTHREFRLGLPRGEDPFLPGDPVPDPDRQTTRVLRAARGQTLFLVSLVANPELSDPTEAVERLREDRQSTAARVLRRLPPAYEVRERAYFPGVAPIAVFVIDGGEAG